MGSRFKPGDEIRRKDQRPFVQTGNMVEVVKKPPKGSDMWPRVWFDDGSWIDDAQVELVPPTPPVVPLPDATPEVVQSALVALEVKPEGINWKSRYERELRVRRKDERRAAKANLENAALRKKARELDWEARKYKALYENSQARQYHQARERLKLIAEVAGAPLDDWIAQAPEPETMKR